MYVTNQVKLFDFGSDLDTLGARLKELSTIIDHLHPNNTSLQESFVQLTHIFKIYWVPRGEDPEKGSHMAVIRRVLKTTKDKVTQIIAKKERRRREKLSDMLTEVWGDVQRTCRLLYDKGIQSNPSRHDIMGLLLSLVLACGPRKTALLDPVIEFQSWTSYEAAEREAGRSPVLSFGIVDTDDELGTIRLGSRQQIEQEIGLDKILVQHGFLKDSETRIEKYLEPGDERFRVQRIIIKPTVVLSSDEIVSGYEILRMWTGYTRENFPGRKLAGNRVGSRDLGPLIEQYFPASFRKSRKNNWYISSHHCRKIYSACAFELYSPAVYRMTAKRIDRSVFTGSILGHGSTSLETSLSYANIFVGFTTAQSHTLPSTAPEREISRLQEQVDRLQTQLDEMKKVVSAAEVSVNTFKLKTKSGVSHVFNKHKAVNWTTKGVEHRRGIISGYAAQLDRADIPVTQANLLKWGLGRPAVQDFLAHRGKAPTTVTQLDPGGTVIAVTDETASENTRRQRLKRDRAAFGETRVIETAQDCDGEVKKKQKVQTNRGATIERDLCVKK
jgi:hypothetical protein